MTARSQARRRQSVSPRNRPNISGSASERNPPNTLLFRKVERTLNGSTDGIQYCANPISTTTEATPRKTFSSLRKPFGSDSAVMKRR
jgi:hypothetical protein